MALTDVEERVAIALINWDIPFEAQVPILGGRSVRGGFVVDFVVYNPFKMPLEVFGEYWHTESLGADDNIKLAALEQYYGYPPIVLWGKDLETQEAATREVYEKVWRA